ncbi:hypothetical protein Scep_012059 [Stephania cephalantha]|uniref:Nuclear speckle splicing regulatory protein 1 N-terminal domain-containing protein n=1 Tax=Stephania cephalantha TaxID=152367 RepID=A0AAP0JE98_9MAGN
MEEDPSVFDYDGVFDQIQEAKVKPLIQDRKERKTLMEKAKQRDMEHEILYERKLVKDRSKEDHLYACKDKFVTGAYKRKLAEQEKLMEEERLRELREEKDDEQDDSAADTSEHIILKAEAPSRSFRTKESDETEVSAGPENNAKLSSEEIKPPTTFIDEGKAAAKQSVAIQTKADHHKRSEDAVGYNQRAIFGAEKSKTTVDTNCSLLLPSTKGKVVA